MGGNGWENWDVHSLRVYSDWLCAPSGWPDVPPKFYKRQTWYDAIKVCIQLAERSTYITGIILKRFISFSHILFNYIYQNCISSSHKLKRPYKEIPKICVNIDAANVKMSFILLQYSVLNNLSCHWWTVESASTCTLCDTLWTDGYILIFKNTHGKLSCKWNSGILSGYIWYGGTQFCIYSLVMVFK